MSLSKPTRRDFVCTSAMAGAALTVPGLSRLAHASRTLTETGYFNTAQSSTEFIHDVKLYETTTAMQSFAWNDYDDLYVLQCLDPTTGDLVLTRLDPSTHAVTGHMTLTGAGHGIAMGIDNQGSSPAYYWTESEAVVGGGSTVWGRKLQRFWFTDGATYSASNSNVEVYDPTGAIEGSTQWQVTCSIDQTYNRIAIRYAKAANGGGGFYNLFDLSDFNNHVYSNRYFTASVAEPAIPAGAGDFQGWCLYGSYIYSLWGNYESTCPGTQASAEDSHSMVARFSLNDNSQWHANSTTAGYTLCHREPESIAVRITGSKPQLQFGASGYINGDSTHNHLSSFYKDQWVPA